MGQVLLLHRECLICTCEWICRRKYSAQVGMEGSSGDCTGTLRHWLIPFLAGLHWPMGGDWRVRCFVQQSDLSTRKSMYNKNLKKEKWNMTLDVLDEKVWLQLFSQSTMGHVTSCHAILMSPTAIWYILDQKLLYGYKLRLGYKGGLS